MKKLDRKITPLILCGGNGSRLAPLSTSERPKPFLKLFGGKSLLQLTAERFYGAQFLSPAIACQSQHTELVKNQLGEIGINPSIIITEPVAKNTAPAIIAATLILKKKQVEKILVTPADHWISNAENLLDGIDAAEKDAQEGKLVLFGIQPAAPENRFGYMVLGAPTTGHCREVRKFIEKPEKQEAEKMISEGNAFWNSGLFFYNAEKMAPFFYEAAPEITLALSAMSEKVQHGKNLLRLPEAYQQVPSIAFDRAVVEKMRNVSATPVDIEWSDIGDWTALTNIFEERYSNFSNGQPNEDVQELRALLSERALKVA